MTGLIRPWPHAIMHTTHLQVGRCTLGGPSAPPQGPLPNQLFVMDGWMDGSSTHSHIIALLAASTIRRDTRS